MPWYSYLDPNLNISVFVELSVYLSKVSKNNVILKLQMGPGPQDIFCAWGPAQGVWGAGGPQIGSLCPSGWAGATREVEHGGRGLLPRKARPGFRGLGLPAVSHCARAWGPRRRPGGGVSGTGGRAAWQGGPPRKPSIL